MILTVTAKRKAFVRLKNKVHKMANYLRIFIFAIIVSLVACSSGNKAKNDSDSPNSDTDTQGSGISFLHFFNNFGKFF